MIVPSVSRSGDLKRRVQEGDLEGRVGAQPLAALDVRVDRAARAVRGVGAARLRVPIDWSTADLGNELRSIPGAGLMQFDRTQAGLANLGWSSTPAPLGMPILCPQASGCANSLAGSLFMASWGSRNPMLAEPLLRRTRWNSVGGANNDVASDNRYVGTQRVAVPAFPSGIIAARVDSDVTQAGRSATPTAAGSEACGGSSASGP